MSFIKNTLKVYLWLKILFKLITSPEFVSAYICSSGFYFIQPFQPVSFIIFTKHYFHIINQILVAGVYVHHVIHSEFSVKVWHSVNPVFIPYVGSTPCQCKHLFIYSVCVHGHDMTPLPCDGGPLSFSRQGPTHVTLDCTIWSVLCMADKMTH